MKIQDLTQDLCNTLAKAAHEDGIRDAAADLETFAREVEWQLENKLINPTDLLVCRTKLARKALAIQQQHVPNLRALVARLLAVAGDEAVKIVVAPIRRDANEMFSGKPMPDIVSEFVPPDQFAENVK